MVEKTVINMVKLNQLREQGHTAEKIAEIVGVSVVTVQTILGSIHWLDPKCGPNDNRYLKKCA